MPPPTYRIHNWNKHFETHETRKLRSLQWVPVSNRHDGSGYRQLILQPDGPAIFGAWVLLVQMASRCPERGTLSDEDGPLTVTDFAFKTGVKEAIFTRALTVLESIGWVKISRNLPESPDVPGESPGIRRNLPDEGKGREGKGSKETLPSVGQRKSGRPGDGLPEVREFWTEAGLRGDPEAFHDHFEARGWRTREGALKDWHAAARNWSRNETRPPPKAPRPGRPHQPGRYSEENVAAMGAGDE